MSTTPFLPLPREEYVEQVHFFATLGARLKENTPAQEILASVRDEILATTKLPMAVDFLLAELRHLGMFSQGMNRLTHYFTPFQCYVMSEAENDRRRFDMRIGLEILRREAQYRTETNISLAGLFLYQFEALCRNRLGYDNGLEAMSLDPSYDEAWRQWILTVRRQIGIVELADLIYVRSEFYQQRQPSEAPMRRGPASEGPTSSGPASKGPANKDPTNKGTTLFGIQEGRIAWASRQKDPLLLFAALHRQLGYPKVPRTRQADPEERLLPVLARRVEQLEARLKLIEEEQRGGIKLERFYSQELKPGDPM